MLASGDKSLTVGDYTFSKSELTSLVILYGHVGTDGGITAMRKQNGSAGYQVAASFKLIIKAVKVASGSAGRVYPLYGDTDVGYNSGSLPTTPKFIGGYTSIAAGPPAVASGSFNDQGAAYIDFEVPAAKYPTVYVAGAANISVIFYCVLEAV